MVQKEEMQKLLGVTWLQDAQDWKRPPDQLQQRAVSTVTFNSLRPQQRDKIQQASVS